MESINMLEELTARWNVLGARDPKDLAPAIAQIHRGVQFVSMVGKHYLEHQADDSHTNMEWLADQRLLAGRWISGEKGRFRLAVAPSTLELAFLDEHSNASSGFQLDGRTKDEVLEWVRKGLQEQGLDQNALKMDLHYDVPVHETDEGAPFRLFDQSVFDEATRVRENAERVLHIFRRRFDTASELRVWPHHFDSGSYIPVSFDEAGSAIKSFSIGYAIPDGTVDEPYFYVTTWSAKSDNEYVDLPQLSSGEWLLSPFQGAILRLSEIESAAHAESQARMVFSFLESAIEASLSILSP